MKKRRKQNKRINKRTWVEFRMFTIIDCRCSHTESKFSLMSLSKCEMYDYFKGAYCPCCGESDFHFIKCTEKFSPISEFVSPAFKLNRRENKCY